MFDAAGSFERDTGDGLAGYERDILTRWDAGDSLETIARDTGRDRTAVKHVVTLYDDRPVPGERAKLVAVNDAFVAACRRVGTFDGGTRVTRSMISVGDIEALLEDRIESLVADLLPNARKAGNEMCVGSIAGEAGQSLRVHIGNGSKRGWWKNFSAHDEKGDALGLIAAVLFARDVGKAVAWAKSWLHLDDADPARIEQHRMEAKARSEQRSAAAEAERAKAARSAKARWHQALPLTAGDPVARYLHARGIDLAQLGRAPGALRYHPDLQYGWPAEGEAPIVLPAMVAMVTRLDGTHIATHRTWLDPSGARKAGVDLLGLDHRGRPNDPKKVMGSPLGGHIPVWKGAHNCPLRDVPEGTDVYVSEGIEDGLTVACADPSLRVICMLALGYLSQMELPPQMGRLIILKQNDAPDSDAARLLAKAVAHHRAAGRRVMFVPAPAGFKDLNDVAQAGLSADVSIEGE